MTSDNVEAQLADEATQHIHRHLVAAGHAPLPVLFGPTWAAFMSSFGELVRKLVRANDTELARVILRDAWPVWSRDPSRHRSDGTRLADLLTHVQDKRLRELLPESARASLADADASLDWRYERDRRTDDESGY